MAVWGVGDSIAEPAASFWCEPAQQHPPDDEASPGRWGRRGARWEELPPQKRVQQQDALSHQARGRKRGLRVSGLSVLKRTGKERALPAWDRPDDGTRCLEGSLLLSAHGEDLLSRRGGGAGIAWGHREVQPQSFRRGIRGPRSFRSVPGARVLVNGNCCVGSSCDDRHPEEGNLAEMTTLVGIRSRGWRIMPSGFRLNLLWPQGFLLSLKEQGELLVSTVTWPCCWFLLLVHDFFD